MQDLHDLITLIKSHLSLIVIESNEELPTIDMLQQASLEVGRPLFKWTITQGLHRQEQNYQPQRHNKNPSNVLSHIKGGVTGLYLLLDFHPYFEDPTTVRQLKEAIQSARKQQQTIILLSNKLTLPPEIDHLAARFTFNLPDKNRLRQIVREELMAWSRANSRSPKIDRAAMDATISNLQGLALGEARKLARIVIHNDGAITPDDLPVLIENKVEILNRNGVLSLEPDTARFADIGGLTHLKSWLQKRKQVFQQKVAIAGLPFPKGTMLLGVQGCGKSLAAKMVSGMWEVPLLRLDVGSIYNKYFGETERNIRESLAAAEAMSPCVLWIDEIEKGMSTNSDDNGTSQRVLATLLTWMAERKSAVFIVATANDIQALPPELIRKGRLDEIFFVDLPDAETRREIFAIHLNKRELSPESFDLDSVVAASEGFSGSEIEQAVVAGLYSALGGAGNLDSQILLQEIEATRPLSVVMAEKIERLRDWASERTVPAN